AVLRARPLTPSPVDVDPHRPRHPEPQLSFRHDRGGIRGPDPRRECPDRPDHVSVTVTPDDELPGMRVAAFRDQLVDDTLVSDVMEPSDTLLPAEIADRLVHLGDPRRWRGA